MVAYFIHNELVSDAVRAVKFDASLDFCDEIHEIGYEMLWQGVLE